VKKPLLCALLCLALLPVPARAEAPAGMVYGDFANAATHPLTGDAALTPSNIPFSDDRHLETEIIGSFDLNQPAETAGSSQTWNELLAVSGYRNARVLGTELRRVLSETGPPWNGLCGSRRTAFLALVETAERSGMSENLRLIVIAFSGEGDFSSSRWCGWENYWSVRLVPD